MPDESAENLNELLTEQAALRRVATLVAQGAGPERLFDSIADGASQVLSVRAISLVRYDARLGSFTITAATHEARSVAAIGVSWPSDDSPLGRLIVGTAQPARIDDWSSLPGPIAERHRENGFGQSVGAPIAVGGEIWGYIGAYAEAGNVLPPECESRLARFAQLMATAIANIQARDKVRDLAEAQEALRRIATLVAQGAEPEAVFPTIAFEVSRVLGVAAVSMIRHNAGAQTFTKIFGTHGERSAVPDGNTWPVADFPEGALLLETGKPARIDDWTSLPGETAARHQANGFGQAISAPILISGEIWGYIGAYAEAGEVLPPECEKRLAEFTELMAAAIANIQARNEIRGLAKSQGALLRVATLVAQGAEPDAVFNAVVVEVSRVLGVDAISLNRYDGSTAMVTQIAATHGRRAAVPVGDQWPAESSPIAPLIVKIRRPVRVNDWTRIPGHVAARHREQGFGQAIAAPIIVDGSVWGYIAAFGEADQLLPPEYETRLAEFTQLAATAVANVQVRDQLRSLAEQQVAALRRVATLVAQQASPLTIFNAVAAEASRALGVARVDVGRCDEDGSVVLLGSTEKPGISDDRAFSKCGAYVAARVIGSGRAARTDNWTTLPPADAAAAREEGFQSAVGAPIMVDGRLWGVIVALSADVLHGSTETRLTDFTHLVASSISNVHARNNLIASRARIVTTSDETRRRIERNLHDGVQQRLISLALGLRALRKRFPVPREVSTGLDEVARDLEGVIEEIRVFSQGLHPALLSRAGLGPSLRELARRSPIPVSVDASKARFPEPVETAVYYVVSEALANTTKHARASEARVTVTSDTATVHATVSDDGAGGASPSRGSGLIGLIDRVEALGGKLTLESPVGQGTVISIELPLGYHPADGRPAL
jgi:signal transduction histidine kinase